MEDYDKLDLRNDLLDDPDGDPYNGYGSFGFDEEEMFDSEVEDEDGYTYESRYDPSFDEISKIMNLRSLIDESAKEVSER